MTGKFGYIHNLKMYCPSASTFFSPSPRPALNSEQENDTKNGLMYFFYLRDTVENSSLFHSHSNPKLKILN